ncbi:carbohydrate kinase [Parabacteroides sp. Marseille-P3160]|uniref:carbohydrate kinase family protein n=1 Tax=Parabacteroides sp. Marseille-P3160 TaxID=1917887 RepID=UPI0009BB3974|nr:carbohydrate kinase [Parabacteroides sp. Marseille-P3160]
MKTKKQIVVGLGELLWDVFPTGKRAGGAPVNFVYHATQLGSEGYAISAIGNDVLGAEIIQELKKNRINYVIETVEYPTGSVIVELNHGSPTYTIVEDVAWDHIPLTTEAIELVRRADAVSFGTLALRSEETRNTLFSLLSYVSPDALRFFDINIRQSYYSKELIESLLEKANVFKINDEELVLLRELFALKGDDDTVCRLLIDKYALHYLILTAGSVCSTIYTGNEKSVIATPKVKVADTVGAGDSFSGAFVYAILSGQSLAEAHRLAVDTAAFVCTRDGAWPAYK